MTVGLEEAHPWIAYNGFSPQIAVLCAVTFCLLCVSALVSGAETSFFSLSHNDVRRLQNSKSMSAAAVLRLLTDVDLLLATILVVNNLVNICIVILTANIIDSLFTFLRFEFLFKTVLVTFLLLLFALKAVLESGKSIYHQAVQFEGAFQQTRWHALVEMAINLTVTLLGIQFFGIYGCLFGTLAALLCRTVLVFRYTYRNILHQRMARPALKWVCNLGLMVLILRIVGIQSRPELSLPGVIGVALLHMIWIGAAFAGAAFLFDHDLLRKLRTLRSSIRS